MGTDIYVYVEKKIEDEWVLICPGTKLAHERDYKLFEALGLSRDDWTPKGLPEDVSPGVDYHWSRHCEESIHASWLPLKDAIKIWLDHRRDKTWGGYQPEWEYFGILDLRGMMAGEESTADDYRVVYWFKP